MRVLGLDYGSKTVGVAVSDPLGLTAQGVEIIRRKSENKMRQDKHCADRGTDPGISGRKDCAGITKEYEQYTGRQGRKISGA